MAVLSLFQRMTGVVTSSRNARGIKRLISGQVLAQLIAVAVTPVVTRLYSPIDYASMALFSAIVAIAASVSTGRYDSAIPLPPDSEEGEREGLQLLTLATGIVLTASIAGGLTIFVLKVIGLNLWDEQLGPWVIALPVATSLLAVSQILFQYGNRKREYSLLATISPASKIVTSTLQISLGYAGSGRTGLLIPTILSPLVGATILLRILREGLQAASFSRTDIHPRRLWATAVSYRDFPFVATWIALINSLNTTIQVLILSALFGSNDVGQYALAMALVSLPVSVIAGSVSSVYYREMASRYGDVDSALALTKKTLKALIVVATPPVILIGVAVIPLFPIVFGDQWSQTGYFAVALLPWAWVRLIGIPLSAALAVSRRQAWQLTWQLALLFGFVSSYVVGAHIGADAVTCTWIASAVAVPLYLLLIPTVIRAIRGQTTQGRETQ